MCTRERNKGGVLFALSSLCLLFTHRCTATLPSLIQIGALYEFESRHLELAFKNAVEMVNSRRDILLNTRLVYDIQNVYDHNSFHASKKACYLAEQGVAAIFGPSSTISSAQVQSMCESLEIPHVQARVNSEDVPDVYSVNLYPHSSAIGEGLISLLQHYKWNDFTILYEKDLDGLEKIMSMPDIDNYEITVRKLVKLNGNYLSLLKQLKTNSHFRIMVHAGLSTTADLLEQIQLQCMHGDKYHYIFTSLDLTANDLSKFMYGGANMTSFRLVDIKAPKAQPIIRRMNKDGENQLMTTESALTFDAVTLFALALDRLDKLPSLFEPKALKCDSGGNWNDGYSLVNYMKTTAFGGLSGAVQYDHTGSRNNISLDVMEMTINGMEKTATWYTYGGLQFLQGYEPLDKDKDRMFVLLSNKTMRVTTLIEPPFTMVRDTDEEGNVLTGNARFSGYCVDLVDMIAKTLGFSYTLQLVKDGQYGAERKDGQGWDGMVGEILTDEADIAIAPLTISYIRSQVVDMTKPFMNTGISILFKRPTKAPPSLFSFLDPFHWQIWMYVITAYALVSFVMFVISRFTPFEWKNPHPCNQDSGEEENEFNLLNALWFAIGCLMQQGSDLAPSATSTRLISGVWWFFTLIMISSYTANLAAFLTVTRMTVPIENVDDLSRQVAIQYGTRAGGSSMGFFKTSSIETFQRMWNYMSTTPDVFVNTTTEGIERVKKGGYAFLMESAMREYPLMQDCSLMPIGGLLDGKGYGLALTKGSAYRDRISEVILQLSEQQKLQELHKKWWKKSGQACAATDDKSNSNQLKVENVGGVFVFLIGGIALSFFVCIFEYFIRARKWDLGPKKSLAKQMFEDLRFAFNCFGSSSRPARKMKKKCDNDMNENENGGMVSFPLTADYRDKYDATI